MNTSIPSGFPGRLREARERCGYSVNELCRIAKVSLGQVSRLEFGDRPNVSIITVQKFADALGVTIDWLWNGSEQHRAPEAVQSCGTFLQELDRTGLASIVARDPNRWALSTIAKAVHLDLLSDGAGEPEGGWLKVLHALEEGRYEVSYGNASDVEAKTRAQVQVRKKTRAQVQVRKKKRKKPRRRSL